MSDDLLRAGDVFVKMWGEREIVHVLLNPKRYGTFKMRVLVLNGVTIESTHCSYRSTYHNRSGRKKFRYVGTMPEQYLPELEERFSLR